MSKVVVTVSGPPGGNQLAVAAAVAEMLAEADVDFRCDEELPNDGDAIEAVMDLRPRVHLRVKTIERRRPL